MCAAFRVCLIRHAFQFSAMNTRVRGPPMGQNNNKYVARREEECRCRKALPREQ